MSLLKYPWMITRMSFVMSLALLLFHSPHVINDKAEETNPFSVTGEEMQNPSKKSYSTYIFHSLNDTLVVITQNTWNTCNINQYNSVKAKIFSHRGSFEGMKNNVPRVSVIGEE